MNLIEVKANIINNLRITKRTGIEQVIENLEKSGFYTAPASQYYHGSYDGGLAKHSLDVLRQARVIFTAQCELHPDLRNMISEDNLIICGLLHDVCKCDIYYKEKKWRKDKDNKWEQYEIYGKDLSNCALGHGEKSVIRLLQWGLELTKSEIYAIRWHMGAFDLSEYSDAKQSFNNATDDPLTSIIISADWLASRISTKFDNINKDE